MLKYAKDQGGYTNGRRPQDYVIFADLILPFAPRHLDIFELSEEGAVNSFKLKMGRNRFRGTYNYQPQRRNSAYIDDDFSSWLQGVPTELCPETYTFTVELSVCLIGGALCCSQG